MAPLFTGVGVALVTVFDARGGLDTAATADLAARLVDRGVRSVLVAGTTGEASALSGDERSSLTRAVRNALPDDVPVIAGTGSTTGERAADLTVHAFDDGADAVLVLSPPGVADPRPYYDAVAKAAGGRPMLAYHFPFASAPGLDVDVLADLPVDGIKDSSGDAERLLRTLAAMDGDVYVGAAPVLTMAGRVGATGAILTLANAEPERCIEAFDGDGEAQRALLTAHLASLAGFPAGIKKLTAERFGVSSTARIGR